MDNTLIEWALDNLDYIHIVENMAGRRLTDDELVSLRDIAILNHMEQCNELRTRLAEIGNNLEIATREFAKRLDKNETTSL